VDGVRVVIVDSTGITRARGHLLGPGTVRLVEDVMRFGDTAWITDRRGVTWSMALYLSNRRKHRKAWRWPEGTKALVADVRWALAGG
jgi:hypothetical protein